LKEFVGYHSEWNLGSPGGWDYQRITQVIGKAVWEKIEKIHSPGIDLDFDHPALFPVYGFVDMLVDAHKKREGANPGLIAVVAEEETVSVINRLAERGEIAENDAKEMIKEITDKGEKEARETIKKVRGANTVKVATKTDIEVLQEKVDALTAKIDALKGEPTEE